MEKLSERFLKTYLYGEKGDFFISTIYRKSSAALNPNAWYYETFGWSLDSEGKQKHIIADNSGAVSPAKATEQHAEVVRQLQETGAFTLEEEDELELEIRKHE